MTTINRTPPVIAAKAWSIYDVKQKKVLHGSNVIERRPIASLTKIATALVVLKLLERRSTLLCDEIIVSCNAATTKGTSACLKQGDVLTVKDALYGLLLPSGNDAAVALAEYIGTLLLNEDKLEINDIYIRLEEPQEPATVFYPSKSKAGIAMTRFIKEMNDISSNLYGTTQTTFVNCHGLDEDGHLSTAQDVSILAYYAMEHTVFRQIANSKDYKTVISSSFGDIRHMKWTNTNKMLFLSSALKPYDGVKTGTTKEAGFCLCTRGRLGVRDETIIIVTILASSTSSKRFSDTSKLFRWARQGKLLGWF